MNEAGPSTRSHIDLEPGSEWRFELEAEEDIAVRVNNPDPVYINSAEIPLGTWYPLYHYLKSAIYAPKGAQLEVTSLPASHYTSNNTIQPALISLHLALERQRILAKRHISPKNATLLKPSSGQGGETNRGPRVMILGPPSSGKSTVLKNLVNMALSSGMGWSVGVVSLDPASPTNLIPGSLSLSTPTHPIPTHHLAHPLGSTPGSVAGNTLSSDVSAAGWWYGHLEPSTKGMDVWEKLVGEMGKRWKERCEKDPNALASGLIMDTSSAFVNPSLGTRKSDPKARYTLLQHAIEVFEIDTLLVIGHEKLSIDLARLFPSINIIRLPKSSGVVDRDESTREIEHSQMVRSYFYGEPTLPDNLKNLDGKTIDRELGLNPYSFQIAWDRLRIIRVGEESAAPSSALPLGSSRTLSTTRLTKVDPGGPAHVVRLLNTVLAVVHLQPGDRLKVEKKTPVKSDTKTATPEVDVKTESKDGEPVIKPETNVEGDGDGEKEVEEDEDEDEVPYIEEIGWREIAGFIVITSIDNLKKKYTLLSPSPGRLPSTVAVAGTVEWVDSA